MRARPRSAIRDSSWCAPAPRRGIEVIAVPGPCALVAALVDRGASDGPILLRGFFAARAARARRARLRELSAERRTLVLYESPHRIEETLADCVATVRALRAPAVLAREITKLHESLYRGSLAELLERAQTDADVAGEIVLVIAGAAPEAARAGR